MNNDKPLNIVNAPDLTEWIKAITWGDTVAEIRYADIKQRDFVAQNKDAVAKMMTHSYMKKHIPFYMNDFIGTDALHAPKNTDNLSECVRAAIADGYPAYIFEASKLPPEFVRQVKRLNNLLHDAAVKHIDDMLRRGGMEFAIDIKFLNKEFADYRNAMTRAKWNAKIPVHDESTNTSLISASILAGKSKE